MSETSAIDLVTPEVEVDEGVAEVSAPAPIPVPEAPEKTVEVKETKPDREVKEVKPVREKTEIKSIESDDVLDTLEPRVEPRDVILKYGDLEITYLQKPLTYFRKMEFFGLLGRTLDSAMSGDDGLTVNEIFGTGATTVTDMANMGLGNLDGFMAAAAKVASYAPDFFKEAYIILLNVPKQERPWAREALESLEDEEGELILETFIDQNWEAIERFFTERVPALVKRVQARRKKDSDEQQ